jgi:hypothetical protein
MEIEKRCKTLAETKPLCYFANNIKNKRSDCGGNDQLFIIFIGDAVICGGDFASVAFANEFVFRHNGIVRPG